MRSNSRNLLLCGLVSLTFLLAACAPEANRERGGGAGADVGNRDESVTMHGDQSARDRIYYQTPYLVEGYNGRTSAEADSPES